MLEAYAVYLECIEEIKETKRTVTAHFVTGSMGFSFMNDMTKMLEQHAKTIKVSGYGDEEGWEY